MKDTNELFVPARKGEGGIIKKMVDGVIVEQDVYEPEDEENIEELDETLDELDDGSEIDTTQYTPVRKSGIEDQISGVIYQQDKLIDIVLNHPEIKANLFGDWYNDNDILNIIVGKVIEIGKGKLIFEHVKSAIKKRYE